MVRIRLATLGLLLMFSSKPSLAENFCDDLRSAIAASTNIMQTVAGPQKRDYMWEANRSISGLPKCSVLRLPDTTIIFSCDGPQQRSFSAVKKDFERLEKSVVSCLPSPPWEHNRWVNKGSNQPEDVGHSFKQADGSSGLLSIGDALDDTPKMNQLFYVSLTVYQQKK